MGPVVTIGLDIAKSVFQVHGVDAEGGVVIRQKLTRARLLKFFGKLDPCLVGIEACGTSHHWARELIELGHDVRLMPPSYVKPYVKRQKNDMADAEAICEAVTRPTMRFVPVKSPEQQSVMVLHRTRSILIRQRIQISNAIRSHMAEFGMAAAVGRHPRAGDPTQDRCVAPFLNDGVYGGLNELPVIGNLDRFDTNRNPSPQPQHFVPVDELTVDPTPNAAPTRWTNNIGSPTGRTVAARTPVVGSLEPRVTPRWRTRRRAAPRPAHPNRNLSSAETVWPLAFPQALVWRGDHAPRRTPPALTRTATPHPARRSRRSP